MKTALILSGQIRSGVKLYENIYRNVIKPHNCDVFFSTWIDDPELDTTVDIFKPRGVFTHFPPDNIYNYSTPSENIKPKNVVSMWASIYNGFAIANESIKYDTYIRYRFDIEAFQELPLTAEFSIPSEQFDYGGINDQIAWGDYEAMKQYSELHLKLGEYYNAGCVFHPETLLKYHLNQIGLIPQRPQFNYRLNR